VYLRIYLLFILILKLCSGACGRGKCMPLIGRVPAPVSLFGDHIFIGSSALGWGG
jgi:hypothetical protein